MRSATRATIRHNADRWCATVNSGTRVLGVLAYRLSHYRVLISMQLISSE
jgi:hypothetical protein